VVDYGSSVEWHCGYDQQVFSCNCGVNAMILRGLQGAADGLAIHLGWKWVSRKAPPGGVKSRAAARAVICEDAVIW
jgi:hypothetical protein